MKQSSIQALGPQLTYVRQIQTQLSNYSSNTTFLDSLIVDPGKWSRLFEKLAKDFQAVNRLWIDKIKSDPQGFTMIGRSLARDRIPRLAEGFNGVDLKRVTRVISGGGETAYEFEMTAIQPPPLPPPTDVIAGGSGTVLSSNTQEPLISTTANQEGQ
jgi:hypothetical protein